MRAESTRLATIAIISMAQQARPNVAGNMLLARAQFRGPVECRGHDALGDVLLQRGALQVGAAQQVLGARPWRMR